MGNINSPIKQKEQKYAIKPEEWTEIKIDGQYATFSDINPFCKGLMINNATKEMVEVYELHFLNQQDLEICMRQYQLRNSFQTVATNEYQLSLSSCPFIYPVRYFRDLSKSELCSNSHFGKLYIDKVDLRLRSVNDIPFQDQVYLYKACLEGFKLLQQKYGNFQITEDMIFINKEGQVKVWIHPNLAKVQPNFQPQYNTCHLRRLSQTNMVHTLIKIIEKNTDYGCVQISFGQYLKKGQLFDRLTFQRTLQYFESFLEVYQIQVGNFMASIYGLFHENEIDKSKWLESQIHKIHYQRNSRNSNQSNSHKETKSMSLTNQSSLPKSGNMVRTRHKIHQSDMPHPQKNKNSITTKTSTQRRSISRSLKDSINSTTQQNNTSIELILRQKGVQADMTFNPKQRQRTQQTLINKLENVEVEGKLHKFQTSSTLPDKKQSFESNGSLETNNTNKKKRRKILDYTLDNQIASDMMKYLSIDPRQL